MKTRLIIASFLVLAAINIATVVGESSENPDALRREKVLGKLLKIKLSHDHINGKKREFNDQFSSDAFDLLLKRLDPQKRRFIQKDVDEMEVYRLEIDNEIDTGTYELPLIVENILKRNFDKIQKFCNEILDKPFDFEKEENLETEAKNLKYCTTDSELKDRWRKYLKYQTLSQYLHYYDSQQTKIKQLEEEQKEQTDVTQKEAPKEDEEPSKKTVETVGPEKSPTALSVQDQETKEDNQKDGEVTETLKEEEEPFVPLTGEELREKARKKVKRNMSKYLSRLIKQTRDDYFAQYFNSITTAFDPHTNYMNPQQNEEFHINISKNLQGIGAVLREVDEVDGTYTKVDRIVPGSASARQGDLKAGDIILSVTQGGSSEEVDIRGMSVREVVQYIRGEKGTTVILKVKKPNGNTKVIPIVRDIVKLEAQLAKSTVLEDTDHKQRIGYIHLPDFYRDFKNPNGISATKDVRKEIESLKGQNIDGLIFDLRNNGGGALDDAKRIAGLFIDYGPIVQVRNGNNDVRVLMDRDRRIEYRGPVIVMVNQFSASASEIFAAAMQDYGRALVVGSGQTHGKGTVQTIVDLNKWTTRRTRHHNLGSLKVTIQKFYRVNGESTQYKGVIPDIVFPDEHSSLESGERFLDHSLPWDTISTARYRAWPKKYFDIPKLTQSSKARMQNNTFFKLIQERDQKNIEKKNTTSIPLSLTTFKKERQEAKSEDEEYDKLLEKLYEDHEKDIDMKGLSDNEKKDARFTLDLWKDPYVRETLAIMSDILKDNKS